MYMVGCRHSKSVKNGRRILNDKVKYQCITVHCDREKKP